MQKLSSVFKNISYYLVLLSLVFIPLYPKLPLVNVAKTFAAIRLEDLLISLTIITTTCFVLLSGKWKELIKKRLIQSLMLFFLIGLVSNFSAIFLTETVYTHLNILHYLRRVELMLLLPVSMVVFEKKSQIKIALIILFLVIALVNIYALGQQFLGWPVISTTNSEFAKGQIVYITEGARANSTFAGHYDLAIFLTMMIGLISSLFFFYKNLLPKIAMIFLGGFSFVILVMTATRITFAATLISIITTLLLNKQRKLIVVIVILAIAALIYPSQLRDRFISTLVVNVAQQGARYSSEGEEQNKRSRLNIPTLPIPSPLAQETSKSATLAGELLAPDVVPGEPLDTTQLGVYRSFAIRLNYEWPRAIRALQKNPFLGTGYSSLDLATDNGYLRSLGEVGILGTMAFYLIIIEILKKVTSFLKSNDRLIKYLSVGTLSLIIGFLVNNLFFDVFEASKVASMFWILMGITISAERIKS